MAPFANSTPPRERTIQHAPSRMPNPDRRELAAIFAGGAAGRLLRVWLGETFTARRRSWPWATFAINVSGSFALGYLATRLQERLPLRPTAGRCSAPGFCGAYTTFSTMEVEILKMLDHHRYGLAAGYASPSIAAGSWRSGWRRRSCGARG